MWVNFCAGAEGGGGAGPSASVRVLLLLHVVLLLLLCRRPLASAHQVAMRSLRCHYRRFVARRHGGKRLVGSQGRKGARGLCVYFIRNCKNYMTIAIGEENHAWVVSAFCTMLGRNALASRA